ncbi:hypothetical protein ISN45_Aa07g002770 [Arabidopsis thaliana x Arabidopsis arenosa]|uniref:Uncharacterized protein n=1 Tax=Arabidopsis thaliana x Arabidopsis arenosa TaxID=1240361 RepID=A0A8T1Y0H0_9BRAS|nr:hypothetical protein ISN45_Aa07g002770 [Arabidopsis thaliana x Arabidopsis arenosa]
MESERYKKRIPKRSRGQDQERSHLQESSIFVRMDPQHTDDVLKHLEKQKELLKEAHTTMLQELQKLEVEHETMMRKLYELMNTHTLNQKKMEETQNVLGGRETIEASSQSTVTTDDEEH